VLLNKPENGKDLKLQRHRWKLKGRTRAKMTGVRGYGGGGGCGEKAWVKLRR